MTASNRPVIRVRPCVSPDPAAYASRTRGSTIFTDRTCPLLADYLVVTGMPLFSFRRPRALPLGYFCRWNDSRVVVVVFASMPRVHAIDLLCDNPRSTSLVRLARQVQGYPASLPPLLVLGASPGTDEPVDRGNRRPVRVGRRQGRKPRCRHRPGREKGTLESYLFGRRRRYVGFPISQEDLGGRRVSRAWAFFAVVGLNGEGRGDNGAAEIDTPRAACGSETWEGSRSCLSGLDERIAVRNGGRAKSPARLFRHHAVAGKCSGMDGQQAGSDIVIDVIPQAGPSRFYSCRFLVANYAVAVEYEKNAASPYR